MSGETPLVSIVIPVFNKADLTLACLVSLAEKTTEVPYEVVIVDNASSDHTGEILAALSGDVTVIRNEENRGFGEACNQGALAANGKHVLFLNNDTICLDNWLPPLVEALEEDDRRGAVQPRLLYPDGRLNDAGGLVFAGGDAWVYGKGSPFPDAPQFLARRAPDYASGACLLVRREAFWEVGGFDPRYAPAYYEDTDLSFAMRAAGWTLLYEPRSTIVHVEGGTAGTDESTGLKAYQVRNKAVFAEKWAHDLAKRPAMDARIVEDWAFRGQSGRGPGELPGEVAERPRKVLVIDPHPPLYDRASGSLRLLQVVRRMREQGHHVTWYCHGGVQERERYADVLGRIGVAMFGHDPLLPLEVGRPPLQSLLATRRYDDVLVTPWTTAEEVVPVVRAASPGTRVIVDTCDIHFVREEREARLSGDPDQRAAARQHKRRELAVYDAADRVVCVSDADVVALHGHVRPRKISVISNAHDEADRGPGFEAREGLLFVGNANHPPNVDALRWWVDEIAPLLRERLPGVTLTVVGNDPLGRLAALAGPGVDVRGWVPEVTPYLHRARLSVAPLRYGAGVKGKVGEALIAGLPVVATSVAVEGMRLDDGQHALVGDTPEAFADAVARLYDDRALWSALRDRGTERVVSVVGVEPMRRAVRSLMDVTPSSTEKQRRPVRERGRERAASVRPAYALCIAGMHRSGTSLAASWLEACGSSIADGRVEGPGVGNVRGHFEDREFLAINASAIERAWTGSHGWQATATGPVTFSAGERAAARALVARRTARGGLWAWKDPRSTVLLETWRALVPDLRTLLLWRPCAEVVDSLLRRAARSDSTMVQIDADTAVRTWLAYNRQVVAYCGAHPDDTALVSVRRLTGDSLAVADELRQRLGLPLTPVPIDGTYDAALLAAAAPARRLPDWALAAVAEVEEALAELSGARLPAYA